MSDTSGSSAPAEDAHAPPTSGVAPYLSVRDGAAAIDFYVR
ncbi:MAG: hypothetical protein ACJA0K_002849, partial [Maricaulis maris]